MTSLVRKRINDARVDATMTVQSSLEGEMNNRFSENSMWARGCVILLSFVGIASARAQDTDGAWNVVQQRGYKLLS